MAKVYVALSGGVDSSVAAALLKERGFNVRGIHIKMWSDPSIPCATKEDRLDAMRAAAHLNIPFETWDLTHEYKRRVVDYMISEYAAGRTPNPDVMCNREIKFGAFWKKALEEGADYVATGHYVKKLVVNSEVVSGKTTNSKLQTTHYKLLTALGRKKDQSYFLWTLTQKQLKYCLFPIGEYTKPEVREMARKFRLPTAEKKESQGLCFIGKVDMREFLKNHIAEREGAILTTRGKSIGRHAGVEFFTIGQRHGIGIGGSIPYYVVEKKLKRNEIIVSEGKNDPHLYGKSLNVKEINWISGKEPQFPLRCNARIRYRQPLQDCRVVELNEFNQSPIHQLTNPSIRQLKAVFKEPQWAVTPGQSIVLYKNDEMLGGGIIQSKVC